MNIKKILKWIGIVLGGLIVIGFFLFLYFIPPFTLAPPEAFIKPTLEAGPSLDTIADPAVRMIAERGKYLVTSLDCSGCHTPPGDQGPNVDEYLAGGHPFRFRGHGTFVTRNLTPDPETGIGKRSDEQILRFLRTGILSDGRQAYYRAMPWPIASKWTEEDRYAVTVYLRHLKPVYHKIPDPDPSLEIEDPAAVEAFHNVDAAQHKTD